MPDGAVALFGIFAGRISCNKCPHNLYLLLQYAFFEGRVVMAVIKRPLKRGRLLVSPPVFSQPPPPPHYRLP